MTIMIDDRLDILLLEDEEGHIQLVLRAFETRPGVRLRIARTLAQARANLAAATPDLAIVDLLLPDGRGIDFLEEIREDGPPFPAIVMTSHGDEEVAVEAMKAGALDYLVKSQENLAQLPHFCARALREWHHINERRAAEEKLRETNRELEAFVYTISHDLRSPLTPIIGYAEFLRDVYGEALDATALDALAEIEGQGHRMMKLLEDLLDLSQAGYLERPEAPVDAEGVLLAVVKELESQFPERIALRLSGPLPRARVPESQLIQIFQNLIGNALRYGGGEVEVGGEREDSRVCYYVRDRGPGIPPQERDRIFEVFYRGSTSASSRGTGIGLATVRKIARAFGGKAWVEETPGGGSTFRVMLVDAPRAEPAAAPESKRFFLEIYGEYCELPSVNTAKTPHPH